MSFNSKKHFNNFGGQDLRSPELLRDQSTATETLNVSLSENLSLTKRRGFETITQGPGGAGSVTFNQVDIATGIETRNRVVIDDTMHIAVDNSLDITYTGTGSPAVENLVVDGEFTIRLSVDGDIVSTINLRSGEEISDIELAVAVSEATIDPRFTVTINGESTINSAYIRTFPSTTFSGSISLPYFSFEEVATPTGISNPFAGHWATRNNDDFELADTAQAREVLYITNGVDGLFKYDGVRLYRAGLPQPEPITMPIAGATAGTFRYRIVYRHTDAASNVIESTPSNELETTSLGDILIPNLVEGTGFDTDGNVEILILRTTDNGSIFFVVDTIPNMATVPTQIYSDITPDLDLVDDFTLPPFELNVLPVARYIDVFRDQLVLTGDPGMVSTVYFSDIQYPEGFSFSNSFLTSTRQGGPNSGIASLDNFLFVFKPNSITAVTGDLTNGQFQVDTLTDEGVGCLSNSSIVEAQGRIWFLGRRGIYSVDRSGVRLESDPLTAIFTIELNDFRALRSVGFYWINEEVILFSLPKPKKTALGQETFFDRESRVLAYHVDSQAWTVWDNMDFSSGIDQDGDEVWFSGSFEEPVGGIRRVSQQMLRTNTFLDYADNTEPVRAEYKANWEHLGEPSIPKKFVRLKVYSLDTPLQAFESTDFSIIVETNHDYLDDVVSKATLAFGATTGGWGEFPWGEATWGEVKNLTRRTRLRPRKTRVLRTVFKNSTLYENILLSGFEFEIALEHDFTMRRG